MADTDDAVPVAIVVTVATDDRGLDITTLAERMREAGMTIDAILPSIGVVTGTATPAAAAAVADLSGIAAVEPDQAVHPRPRAPDNP